MPHSTGTGRLLGERAQQDGLADARLTGHEHDRSPALGRAASAVPKHLQGVVALQQPHPPSLRAQRRPQTGRRVRDVGGGDFTAPSNGCTLRRHLYRLTGGRIPARPGSDDGQPRAYFPRYASRRAQREIMRPGLLTVSASPSLAGDRAGRTPCQGSRHPHAFASAPASTTSGGPPRLRRREAGSTCSGASTNQRSQASATSMLRPTVCCIARLVGLHPEVHAHRVVVSCLMSLQGCREDPWSLITRLPSSGGRADAPSRSSSSARRLPRFSRVVPAVWVSSSLGHPQVAPQRTNGRVVGRGVRPADGC